jgi:hypothetical protein
VDEYLDEEDEGLGFLETYELPDVDLGVGLPVPPLLDEGWDQ